MKQSENKLKNAREVYSMITTLNQLTSKSKAYEIKKEINKTITALKQLHRIFLKNPLCEPKNKKKQQIEILR